MMVQSLIKRLGRLGKLSWISLLLASFFLTGIVTHLPSGQAADTEGKVIVYGPPGPQYRPALINAFQKAHPDIRVEYFGSNGRVAATKLLQERRVGLYNVDIFISGSTNGTITLKNAKADIALPPILSAELKNPKIWQGNKLQWADTKAPYTTLMFECSVSIIINVNSKLVDPKQFTSYKDFLKPKWKGKIVGTDIRRPGPGGTTSRFMYKNPELGPEYLTRLFRDTDILLSSDQRQLVDLIAQGQYPIGFFVSSAAIHLARSQGLPIQPVPVEQFKEGGSMGPSYGAISHMERAPNPKAAKVYINWLLSRSGQMAWQKHTAHPSCRTDIPKEGLNEVNVPKPGHQYVQAGTDVYSRLTGGIIRNLITKALRERKKN